MHSRVYRKTSVTVLLILLVVSIRWNYCKTSASNSRVISHINATTQSDGGWSSEVQMGDMEMISQPSNVTVSVNQRTEFTVEAKGDNLTYQWYYKKAGSSEWNKWNGHSTASTSAISNVTWDGMQVYCKVTDEYGNFVDSKPASITIRQPLRITVQPSENTVDLGDSITLSLKAEGIGLTYQWYYKKVGQISFNKWNNRIHASETVTPNVTWNGIQLYCVVKDKAGNTVKSNTIKVTVTQELKIITQPINKTIKFGDNISLSLKVQGIGLTYQWYYKKTGQTSFNKWNGRTHASETCTPNATWNGIQLYCIVKDSSDNQVQSNIITVKVNLPVIIITQQPQNQSIIAGNSITLSVKATGSGLRYQWYFKKKGQTSFNIWNGRTHAAETVSPNSTWDGIQLYCKITDGAGATVNSATVTINVLSITTQPANVTVAAGSNATFKVVATGSGLKYQWQYKKSVQTSWNNWGARTTASTTATSNDTWQGMKVRCIVTDSAGNKVTSNAATITIK